MKKILLKIIYSTLAFYARKVIAKHKPFVIAITGSAGKTTTKEAIYQVLHDHLGDAVRKTPGNLNAEIGIPLTILGYDKQPNNLLWPVFLICAYFRTFKKEYPKNLVLEIGVEHKGDMAYFSTIVKPGISVITEIAPIHIVNFSDMDDLAQEKISIIKYTDQGRTFVNSDNGYLSLLAGKNITKIGIKDKGACFRAEDISVGTNGTDYRIVTTGQKIAIRSRLIGDHLIHAQLFAFAIGRFFGIQALDIKKSIEKLEPISGRMNIVEGEKNITIIDDTYNANLASVKAALEVLSKFRSSGRKVLIMGNMNELGGYEKEIHREVGEFARGKCDLAIFVGPNAAIMAAGYNDKKSGLIYDNRNEVIKDIGKLTKPKDVILIKASQNNNFFEEITKALMKNKELAPKMLVRQSYYWMRKKK